MLKKKDVKIDNKNNAQPRLLNENIFDATHFRII